MTTRLLMRGRGRVKQLPVCTVGPTNTGDAISGQLRGGSAGTWSRPYFETRYRYLRAPDPFTNFELISGANASTYLQTDLDIDHKIIRGVSVRGQDGWSDWADSIASPIVQDDPPAVLAISGTPPSAALQGSPVSFVATAFGGTPAPVGDDYTFTLGGPWPVGAAVSPISGGQQANISASFPSTGTISGLTVIATDSLGDVAILGPFSVVVSVAANVPKLTKGSGWTGVSSAPASRGTAIEIGYGELPGLWWADEQFNTFTGEAVLEVIAFAVSPKSFWLANQIPVFGIYSLEAAVDGGPWQLIAPSYNPTTNRWSFRFKVDANDFDDGVWNSTSREVRVRAVGQVGDGATLQGSDYNWPGYRFSTNANSTLQTLIKYADIVNGNDANSGTSGSPYKTLAKAMIEAKAGGFVKLKAGSGYSLSGISTAIADTGRWITVQADDGLPASQVIINQGGGNSTSAGNAFRAPKVKFKGVTTSKIVPTLANYAVCFDATVMDQGDGWARVLDNAPYNYLPSGVMAYMVNCSVTNWAWLNVSARLIKGCNIGTLGSEGLRSTHCALNCTFDTILEGRRETSPGVWDGGGNVHGDLMQPYRAGGDYHWGGCYYNITAITGNMRGQGPFIKDAASHRRFFLVNWDIRLGNVERNSFFLQNLETLYGSMFYNVKINYGQIAWAGACVNVIAIMLVFTNQLGGNNSVPGQITNFTP